MQTKEHLRARALERRAARSPEDVLRAGAAFADSVLALCDRLPPGGLVASYLSTAEEPDTRALVSTLCARDLGVIVPVVLARGILDWARYAGPGTTTPNRLGIDEPAGPRLGPEAVAGADLVVVPGLAVGPDGYRLGRGGGFYDRALARIGDDVPRVLMLYDDEVLDAVPHEPHDQPVDVVVTPARTLRLR